MFVRDSAVAAEKLQLAERMAGSKQWDTAAEVYQEILDKYPDRVLASSVDNQGRVTRYASVSSAVQERLCKWPADGREVYNSRYGPAAQTALENAGDDPSKLHDVSTKYFVTEAGKAATLRLVERHFARGVRRRRHAGRSTARPASRSGRCSPAARCPHLTRVAPGR
ncbi:MAG: hypothetical protein QM770_01785 [Tepidisphaeraceae bacterium]